MRFSLESYAFGFLIGGIGAVAYEFFLRKKVSSCQVGRKTFVPGLIFIVGFATLFILNNILKINSIYASSLGFIVSAIFIWIIRPDLVKDSFASGLLVAIILPLYEIIFFNIYPGIVERWWLLNNLSRIFVIGVPLEEIIWSFSWGMIAGPLYEFWQGFKLK